MHHGKFLALGRCPHCSIHRPSLASQVSFDTRDHRATVLRHWRVYVCANCGGPVLAGHPDGHPTLDEFYPSSESVAAEVPARAASFLQQAIDSAHSPDGAVMLCASAVDAMLKAHGYKGGTLYQRIDKAAAEHLITEEMARWAHHVRLEANEPRHADEDVPPSTANDARRCISFAKALAEILFVLPSRVQRGLQATQTSEEDAED